ncbi:MAG: hypothetical protein IJC41_05080, partial [Firmicutes bacterium]|nr:hypothetical protein [Bacillota bacterium]
MKKVLIYLLAAAMVMFTAGCGADEGTGTETPASLQISLEDWPVIDGATALAPYYEAMAAE